jgi:hypothetical protein
MNEKVWVIEDFDEEPVRRGPMPPREEPPPLKQRQRRERNPALAISLSLLLWGGGQFYTRQRKLGVLFLLLMANFYMFLGVAVVCRESAAPLLQSVHITPSFTLAALWICYFTGLLVWMLNAVQAYYSTTKTLSGPFQGVLNPLLPFLCSLVMPGWGQFLNGQAKKGLFFMCFGVAGLVALPSVLIIFPLLPALEPSDARLFLEGVLTASVVASPVLLLMWILGVHDATRVCLDAFKKEPLQKRIMRAFNSVRRKTWIRSAVPRLKQGLLLVLLLVLSIVVSRHYFPRNYYLGALRNLRGELARKEMVLLPRLIDRVLPARPQVEQAGHPDDGRAMTLQSRMRG